MKSIEPNQTIQLFIFYMENNVPITGLTDLTVKGIDSQGNVILAQTSMTEEISTPGKYFYMWDVNNNNLLDKFVNIYYKKGSEVLDIEEFFFTFTEDMDGHAS